MKKIRLSRIVVYPSLIIVSVFASTLVLLTGGAQRPPVESPEVIVQEKEPAEDADDGRCTPEIDYTVPPTVEPTTLPEVASTPEPTVELTPEPTPYVMQTDEASIIALCKMVWGEDRGGTKVEQAACVWCALNRVDGDGWSDTIIGVLSAPHQFSGYNTNYPVTDEIRELVEDVVLRWEREKLGEEDVGRVLPRDYCWFSGDGRYNYFRNAYSGNYSIWDWSLPNPYIDE